MENEDFLVGVSVARWGEKGGVLAKRWIRTPCDAAMGQCEGLKYDSMLGKMMFNQCSSWKADKGSGMWVS